MKWVDIQENINHCELCRPRTPRISAFRCQAARPPEPRKHDILFMSEAPPALGGFWDESSVDDALRRNLCSILLPETDNVGQALDSFKVGKAYRRHLEGRR